MNFPLLWRLEVGVAVVRRVAITIYFSYVVPAQWLQSFAEAQSMFLLVFVGSLLLHTINWQSAGLPSQRRRDASVCKTCDWSEKARWRAGGVPSCVLLDWNCSFNSIFFQWWIWYQTYLQSIVAGCWLQVPKLLTSADDLLLLSVIDMGR